MEHWSLRLILVLVLNIIFISHVFDVFIVLVCFASQDVLIFVTNF
jgi:hypothetical protein